MIRKIFFVFTATFCYLSQAGAMPIPDAPQVAASSYILMDFQTGKILAQKNAEQTLPPASLTKIMTSYVIAHELKVGNISNDDKVLISEKAWAKNFPDSSKMFIEVNKEVLVRDLHRGIIVSSGNDASVAMAEHIGGTESGFVDLMNHHAKQLGMNDSQFENSNGLPNQSHRTTAHDMAILTRALIKNFPDVYKEYQIKEFTYNAIKQYNRNRLLWDKSLEVDGVKTGHTEAAGYCLVSSAVKDDMRLIAVVMGAASENARTQESKKLLNYGLRFFETLIPFAPGESLHQERVWMGEVETLNLGLLNSYPLTIARGQRNQLKASFEISQRIIAPVSKGQTLGQLKIMLEGKEVANFPLVALEDIPEAGWFGRLVDWGALKMADWF